MTTFLRDTEPPSEPQFDVPRLYGRAVECARMDQLLQDASTGRAAALRVLGERGIGKSSLLDHVARRADGYRVLRARGVADERDLPYAGLQLLCAPLLEELERLEPAQQAALSTAIGLSGGEPPDRLLVSVAALNLLTGAAEHQPVCCLVDDAHWLDTASLLVLAFVVRRAERSPLLVVFGECERQDVPELDGLPEMRLEALPWSDAHSVLLAGAPGKIDAAVTERILLEARGNPRALLEAVDGTTAAELAGGYAIPAPRPDSRHRDHDCVRRARRLPADARQLLLTVAAEPTGDPAVASRAAAWLGVDAHAAELLEAESLLTFGPRVVFGCATLRAAVYAGATPPEIRLAHRAVAEAIISGPDLDRRAWHLALSTGGLDDRIAADLERSAAAAQARGGIAARAAFLERAALVTADPAARARRALTAAGAQHAAGSLDAAQHLLSIAASGPPDPAREAYIGFQRARIEFATRRDDAAPQLLLAAARRLRAYSPGLARRAHLEALAAVMLSCRGPAAPGVRDVARAARATTAEGSADPIDLLISALAARVLDGPGAAADALRRALTTFGADSLDSSARGWSWLAGWAAADGWNEDAWAALTAPDRHERRNGNGAGHEGSPPGHPLTGAALLDVFRGRFQAAQDAIPRGGAHALGTGSALPNPASLLLTAWQGNQDVLRSELPAVCKQARQRGDSLTLTVAQLAEAVLHNGAGHYEQALAAAREAVEADQLALSGWACIEFIEAATRCGQRDDAAAALARLGDHADAAATQWALGVRATAQALLSDVPVAEQLYQEAIDRLSKTGIRLHLARAQLLYGEWLRRQNRRVDARVSLRAAHQTFAAIGAEGFAVRAHAELLATGERVGRRSLEPGRQLTTQESRIGYLARDGLSNSEIGARLFLSPRTVEYHLHKVFAKLGITSRTELHLVLQTTTTAMANNASAISTPTAAWA
ncbi:helix-turn-helix transcriptional regulator [Kribbella pratensis]|uniref:helix-turn-helix transcriptional regulator n=1 Tax=Kribbella pratensis TaxID=2512112 RepID=UPI0010653843|nr:LuxR family transcriptional regulator [Kribbella pratensis]